MEATMLRCHPAWASASLRWSRVSSQGGPFTAWVCSSLADIPTSPKGLIMRKGKASCKPSIPTACWRLKGLLCGVFVCLFACSCFCFQTAPCNPVQAGCDLCFSFLSVGLQAFTILPRLPLPHSHPAPHQCIHIHLFLYSRIMVFALKRKVKGGGHSILSGSPKCHGSRPRNQTQVMGIKVLILPSHD